MKARARLSRALFSRRRAAVALPGWRPLASRPLVAGGALGWRRDRTPRPRGKIRRSLAAAIEGFPTGRKTAPSRPTAHRYAAFVPERPAVQPRPQRGGLLPIEHSEGFSRQLSAPIGPLLSDGQRARADRATQPGDALAPSGISSPRFAMPVERPRDQRRPLRFCPSVHPGGFRVPADQDRSRCRTTASKSTAMDGARCSGSGDRLSPQAVGRAKPPPPLSGGRREATQALQVGRPAEQPSLARRHHRDPR